MAERPGLGKLVIVGVGLIGGSFALAMKEARAARSIVGVGRGRTNLDTALRLGIVDRAYTLDERWLGEAADADLVMLATPVGQMPRLFATLAPALGATTLLTDAGSTKQDVIAAARSQLGTKMPNFVPGHPIAGTERSGASAAFAALFQHRKVVLTPLAQTDPVAVASVSECWERCGASVRLLDAARHDAILAAVSHLPHVLAFALVAELASRSDAPDCFEYAGTGLRDFTRLASGEASMWRDVCLANRGALRSELARYRTELERIDALLASGDGAALQRLFEDARSARGRWLGSSGDEDSV